MPRALIVNADDFGYSAGVNQGIANAFEHGIVRSASLMVRWSAALDAAVYARIHPALSVGLHVDLAEWVYRHGASEPRYQVVAHDDAGAVTAEVARQLAVFRGLMGRDPTHLDSHQHVHRREPARSVLVALAADLRVPLRGHGAIHYQGAFYGQTGTGEPLPSGIGVEHLLTLLEALPEGVTELGCHPGTGDDIDSVYCTERAEEVRTLCAPRIRDAIIGLRIELRSHHPAADLR